MTGSDIALIIVSLINGIVALSVAFIGLELRKCRRDVRRALRELTLLRKTVATATVAPSQAVGPGTPKSPDESTHGG